MFELTDTVLEQYERVRLSGVCNMFDKNCVQRVANDMGFNELVIVIDDGNYADVLSEYDPDRAAALV